MLFIEFLVEKGRLRERRQKSRGGFKTDQRTNTEDEFHSVIYTARCGCGILESFTNTFWNDPRCARGNCIESQFWRLGCGIF